MSDLKNVLKAGFLLSASLLATGCGDNKSSDTAGNDGGNGSGPKPEVNPTVVPSPVRSTKFDLGNFSIHFTQTGQQVNTFPVTVPEAFEGKYDVFKNQKTDQKPDQKPSLLPLQNSLVKISSYKNPKDDGSLLFDAKQLAGGTVAGIVLNGSIDGETRYTVPAEIQGEMSTGVLVCRNAKLTAADDKPASITSGYTYVGIDAAIGYNVLRQKQDGTELKVPVGINSQIEESSPTAMSADTPTVTGLADTPTSTTTAIKEKLISAATASKSTKASKVDNPEAQKDKAVPSVAKAPEASKITLVTKKPNQLIRDKLASAGIVLLEDHGALDIAGRIATVDAKDTVITALALDHPVLQNVPELATNTVSKEVAKTLPTNPKILADKKEADKAVAEALKAKTKADKALNAAEEEYAKAQRASDTAKVALNDLPKQRPATGQPSKDLADQIAAATTAQKEAEKKAIAAKKARDDAKVAAQKASEAYAAASNPASKKTQATAETVADASKATADKTAATQAFIEDSTGAKKFFFTVEDGGFYAEIGDLTVGTNVVYHANTGHALWVHKLTLNADLGVHALADLHTFDKLKQSDLSSFVATSGDKIVKGQNMMKILQDEGHSTQTSNVAESSGTTPYLHYDSNTQFPLWVSESDPGLNKLVLKGVDLAPGVSLEAGVYAMPLVKDMSMKLLNSSDSADFVLANKDGQPVIRVTEWKIVSNGYADLVLLIKVVQDASSKPMSSDTLNRVLMSADVQAGRSVASSTLAGLVSKLDPSNLVSGSFANLSTSRINQAAQVASLTRGVSAANAEKLGAVEQYNVTFNYAGAQFGLSYNVEGGNAFSSRTGTTSFGANVATDMFGLKAIVSAEASVDAGKNAYAASSVASYNAGLTFAKAYSLGGLSVVPMGGLGVSSNALNSYSAVVPMAAGALGLSMNDVSFSAATFHAGVSVALDDAVATVAGANASLTLGVAGYLASAADAKLSTSEGKSFDLQFDGSAVTPYAQFGLGLASGEKLNTLVSSGIVAINFGLDR